MDLFDGGRKCLIPVKSRAKKRVRHAAEVGTKGDGLCNIRSMLQAAGRNDRLAGQACLNDADRRRNPPVGKMIAKSSKCVT